MSESMIKPTRHMKRDADRAFKRFDASGCIRCGKGPILGVMQALLSGIGGKLRLVHLCCVRSDDTVIGTGAFVATGRAHIEGDRQWFEANPSRVARLRWPVDGEVQLLVNHARLVELKQSGQSPCSDRQCELLRAASPSQVAILVLRKSLGVRMRQITFLDCAFEEVTVEAVESAGNSLLSDAASCELPTESEYLRNLAEIHLLEVSESIARMTGKPSITDIARAIGESRSSTRH
jgi:hypothetical protein